MEWIFCSLVSLAVGLYVGFKLGLDIGTASQLSAVEAAREAEAQAMGENLASQTALLRLVKGMLAASGLEMGDFNAAMERLKQEGLCAVSWIAKLRGDRDRLIAARDELLQTSADLQLQITALQAAIANPSRN